MCTFDYSDEDTWGDRFECPNYLQLQCDMGEAKSNFKEILEILYSNNQFDVAELEHYLIEMSDALSVRFPENKNINVRSKC